MKPKPKLRWRKGKPAYALMGLFSEMNGSLLGWVVRSRSTHGYQAFVLNFFRRDERVLHAGLLRDAKRAVEAALEKRND